MTTVTEHMQIATLLLTERKERKREIVRGLNEQKQAIYADASHIYTHIDEISLDINEIDDNIEIIREILIKETEK